jgi:hypothetical protein
MQDSSRRLLITIAVLFVWRLGSVIPIPGVILRQHDSYSSWQIALSSENSILKFGVDPIFSVLIIIELLRIAFPAFRRWEAFDRSEKRRLPLYVLIASITLAGAQALRLVPFYETWGQVEQPGIVFEVTLVVSLVTGVALAGWLAHLITLYGIGNGFWLLFSLPILAGLSKNIWLCLNMWWQDHDRASRVWWYPTYIPTRAELGLLGTGLVAVATFALVFVLLPRLSLRERCHQHLPKENDHRLGGCLMESVWPPVLANVIVSWFVLPILAILNIPPSIAISIWMLAGVALIPFLTMVRERGAVVEPGKSPDVERKPVLTLALLQAVIWGTSLLWIRSIWPLPIWDGYSLIIAITLALALTEQLFGRKLVALNAAKPLI